MATGDLIIQKRPHELGIYQQLSVGDAGYIDPATIWVMVDRSDWSEPLRIPLSEVFSSSHAESDYLSPSSTSVAVTYDQPFESSSYYYDIKAYKTITIPGIGDVQETVKYHDLETTVNGFSLVLSEYTGVTISYIAFELGVGSAFSKDYIYATGSVANLVVPNSDKVQITGISSTRGQGITLSSNEFTVVRGKAYKISVGFATLNETASNLISIDIYDDDNNELGITMNFVPRNDYDNFTVIGTTDVLSEDDVIRIYLSAPSTGLTLDLSTITINIEEV